MYNTNLEILLLQTVCHHHYWQREFALIVPMDGVATTVAVLTKTLPLINPPKEYDEFGEIGFKTCGVIDTKILSEGSFSEVMFQTWVALFTVQVKTICSPGQVSTMLHTTGPLKFSSPH